MSSPKEDGTRTHNSSTFSEFDKKKSQPELTAYIIPVIFVTISYFVPDEDNFCQKGSIVPCPAFICPEVTLCG